jgi:hypothetical protein
MLFGLLPSHGTGESGARARLAFRILVQSAFKFVATSMSQMALESRFTDHITPWRPLFLVRQRRAVPRVPSSFGLNIWAPTLRRGKLH